MKDKRLFGLAVLVNILQMSICFLYSGGGLLLLMLFVPLHILLFMLNNSAAKTWLHVFILGGLHVIMTLCSHQLYGWLYLQNICDDIYRSDWFVRPSIRITLDGKQYLLEEEAIGNAYSDIEELYTELDAVYSVGNIYFELVAIDNLQSSTILSLQIGTEIYTDYDGALSGFQKDLRKQASLLSAVIVLAVWMTIGISRGKWKNIYRRTFVG